RALVGRQPVQLRLVADGRHHQMARRIGEGVQNGEAEWPPLQDQRLLVVAGQQRAEQAAVLAVGDAGDVVRPPPGPQPAHPRPVRRRHYYDRAATSAASRVTKSSRGTSRSGRSAPRTLTPTVRASTSESPTTSR